MKLSDSIWLSLCKSKPWKGSYYFGIILGGFGTALFLIAGILLFYSSAPWLGPPFILATIISFIWSAVYDYKKGYVNALHERQVSLWKEKRRKLGVK